MTRRLHSSYTRLKNMEPIPPEEAIGFLFEAVQKRPRPEDVAAMVLYTLNRQLTRQEHQVILNAAQYSAWATAMRYTLMMQDFERPVGLTPRQAGRAEMLFDLPSQFAFVPEMALDIEVIERILQHCAPQIGYRPGSTNFKRDRLNRVGRSNEGLDMGHRAYNKRWRFLKRFENKISRMILNERKYQFTRYSKSALATRLSREELGKDLVTACFVAYMAARMSRRSVFTNAGQDRAYDEVSDALFRKMSESLTTNWWAVAHVKPTEFVLEKLTNEQRGELLGMWYSILLDLADHLDVTWRGLSVDPKTLIVERGCDSTTWNQAAGAWNQARAHWISLVHSLGMSQLLDDLCPGKVLRLMAADVTRWHELIGVGVHPDTKVWAQLPYPWLVVQRKVGCGRDMIEAACVAAGVDFSGWSGPRSTAKPVEFKPTPELVHGVEVSSPELGAALRKAKWFSGKGARPLDLDVEVKTDEHGFVVGARESVNSESAHYDAGLDAAGPWAVEDTD